MKILVAGDTHGNAAWWSRLIEYAVKQKCKIIVQLGDFGYWEHTAEGKRFLDRLQRKLERAGITVYFIDGNHENHPMLWEMYPPEDDGFCDVRANLRYIPRGHAWTWDGVRFMGLGGAYSIDKGWRLDQEEWLHAPRTLWWPTELISEMDAQRAVGAGKVDVLFSHDCPWGVNLPGIDGRFPVSNANRQVLAHVVAKTRPDLLMHGHYHMRNSDVLDIAVGASRRCGEHVNWHRVRIEGFDCDGRWNTDSWTVISTTDLNSAGVLTAAA